MLARQSSSSRSLARLTGLALAPCLALVFAWSPRVEAHAIGKTESEVSGPDATAVHRLKHPITNVNPIERPILDYLEQMHSMDGSHRHVKYLLNEQDSYDFSAQLSTVDILHRSRFEYQVANVTSSDGYVTQLVRIINPLVHKTHRWPQPVVMYGGQGVSSAVFLMASLASHTPARWPADPNRPEQTSATNRSLAIMLANHGYDVWLVGARGTDKACRRRAKSSQSKGILDIFDQFKPEKIQKMITNFDIKGDDYWSFSHDEIIEFEFGAQLGYVLKATNQQRLTLITYSNGGFIAHAFASLHSKFAAAHIDTMVSLAPAVYVNRFNLALSTTDMLSLLSGSSVMNESLNWMTRGIWHQMCRSKVLRYTMCKTALNMIYGFSDSYQTHIELNMIDYTGLPMSATGFKQTLQCTYSGHLQRYDHGLMGNLIRYKQLTPPEYKLSEMRLPITYVITGEHDTMVDTRSVSKLVHECGQKPIKSIVVPGYNHLDLIAAWNVGERVNLPVLQWLDRRYFELRQKAGGEYYQQQKQQQLDKQRAQAKAGTTTTVAPLFREPLSSEGPKPLLGPGPIKDQLGNWVPTIVSQRNKADHRGHEQRDGGQHDLHEHQLEDGEHEHENWDEVSARGMNGAPKGIVSDSNAQSQSSDRAPAQSGGNTLSHKFSAESV